MARGAAGSRGAFLLRPRNRGPRLFFARLRPSPDAVIWRGGRQMIRFQWGALALSMGLVAAPALAAPPVEPQVINQIADQGFNHGEVADTLAYLSDEIGGRMTNSPAMRKAEAYARPLQGLGPQQRASAAV